MTKVSDKLGNLQPKCVVVPLKFSSWAAPVVPVIKHDGNVRLRRDYNLTIDSVAKNEVYPLPRIEELVAAVSGGKIFQSWTYHTLTCTSNQMSHLNNNTHHGLYCYACLLFGVASATAAFQHTMEMLLNGLPMVVAYLDNILVAGKMEQEI